MAEQRSITLVVINSQLLQAGLSATHTFSVEGGSIGAGLEADWQLRDNRSDVHISHCHIVFKDAVFCLKDSCEATYINGASIPIGWRKIARLNENDVIDIGTYQIRVHLDAKDIDIDIFDLDGEDTLDVDINGHHLAFIDAPKNENNDDPLEALDKFELELSGDSDEADLDKIEGKTGRNKIAYLLAKDHDLRGGSITMQADCEHDESAAIYLKRPSTATLSNIEHETNAVETPLGSQKTGTFRSKLLSSYRHLIGSELAPTESLHRAKKDNLMNDKTLDLLDDDIDENYNLYEGDTLSTSGTHHIVAAPLLRGLGVQTGDLNNLGEMQILSEEIGASLQAAIKGLLELHSQVENSRYGIMNKNLQPIEDNPLRLGLSYEETVQTMFDVQRSLVHLSAPAAIAESLQTVKNHNESVQLATSEALNQILRAFSPEVLTRRFNSYRRAGERVHKDEGSWAWEMYQNYYTELTSNRQQGFEKLFWEIFDQSYDKTLREKQQEK